MLKDLGPYVLYKETVNVYIQAFTTILSLYFGQSLYYFAFHVKNLSS